MTGDASGETVVTDRPDRERFEITVSGDLAGMTVYRPHQNVYAFVHTEIADAHEGKGLGSVLVRGAMDAMRTRGLQVLPYCPFVARFLRRHAEYRDLVPESRRAEFGLDGGSAPSASG